MANLTTILDRLKLMHDDINGITALASPPAHVASGDLPVYYPVLRGIDTTDMTVAQVAQTYRIECRLLVRPYRQDSLASGGLSQAQALTQTLVETINTYYIAHRDLSTESLGGLLLTNFAWSTTGVRGDNAPVLGSDANLYIGSIFTLNIPIVRGE